MPGVNRSPQMLIGPVGPTAHVDKAALGFQLPH